MSTRRPHAQVKPQLEETINRRFGIAKLIAIEIAGFIGFCWLLIEAVRREIHF